MNAGSREERPGGSARAVSIGMRGETGDGVASGTTLLAFDLGDTLVEYEGVPLSWEEHYPAALKALAARVGILDTTEFYERGIRVLRAYNTRLNPRTEEVGFDQILSELLPEWRARAGADELACAEAFFSPFRQKLRCLPDAIAALEKARSRGARIAVFTDVPYGMPTALVEEDMRGAGVLAQVDLVATSRDIGVRKPDGRGLTFLMSKLGAAASRTTYVGNERKDIDAGLAAGCTAVLLDRAALRPQWGQHRSITSLREL